MIRKHVLFILSVVLLSLGIIPLALAQDACEGNFDCDEDVDGTDAAVFKDDFGRSAFSDPCYFCSEITPLPKTGQTISYAPGDDGDLEKGVAWPNPRFTDDLDGTIKDNLTGLVWLKNANCFVLRTWEQALSDCNGLANGSCGLTDGSGAGDWRLPNFKEFYSLMDLSKLYLFPPGLFINIQPIYYTSNSYSFDNYTAMAIMLAEAGRSIQAHKEAGSPVWCVRDPL